MSKPPFDPCIVDNRFFFKVESFQRVNIKKQIKSTMESQGVSQDQVMHKPESLNTCVLNLGPTLDMLRVPTQHKPKKRQKLNGNQRLMPTDPKNKVSSPVKHTLLNSIHGSVQDLQELIDVVEKEETIKQQVRHELRISQELDQKVPFHIRSFLDEMKACRDQLPPSYQSLPDRPLDQLKDAPEIQFLLSYLKWNSVKNTN